MFRLDQIVPRKTSRQEELQGSFLSPLTHRCPGRARRHLTVKISKSTSAHRGIELGSPGERFSQSRRLVHCAALAQSHQVTSTISTKRN